jgi:hypothetical protein
LNEDGGRQGLIYIGGNNLQQGSISIHRRSRNDDKPNASKTCGIAERKDLEDTRESSGHEKTDRWPERPHGGARQTHTSPSRGDFSHGSF